MNQHDEPGPVLTDDETDTLDVLTETLDRIATALEVIAQAVQVATAPAKP